MTVKASSGSKEEEHKRKACRRGRAIIEKDRWPSKSRQEKHRR